MQGSACNRRHRNARRQQKPPPNEWRGYWRRLGRLGAAELCVNVPGEDALQAAAGAGRLPRGVWSTVEGVSSLDAAVFQ
jgi:hypothetical protein